MPFLQNKINHQIDIEVKKTKLRKAIKVPSIRFGRIGVDDKSANTKISSVNNSLLSYTLSVKTLLAKSATQVGASKSGKVGRSAIQSKGTSNLIPIEGRMYMYLDFQPPRKEDNLIINLKSGLGR